VRTGPWSAEASEGLVQPPAGKLARTLYSEIVSRTYFHDDSDAFIMALGAYGDTQSDLLQLHRPESCYPAVGFTIQSTRAYSLPVGNGMTIPARQVVASADNRVENILYWTRIGESLPQSAGEQRKVRLADAMHGFISDGLLMRFSAIGDSAASFAMLEAFVPTLLDAIPRGQRPALIGSRLSQTMA
jgi:EpsI family protein